MPDYSSYRFKRSGMWLAVISAAFAGEAGAVAGRVDFATAGATIAGRDGQLRPLAKGAELDSGDTIRTDAAARAQIRFTDGSYVSLQPNTEFAIKDYNYEGKTDGSERGFFGLAKGAMRTVTGLVGRINRNRYQIVTPTATVGIRGTGGRIEVLSDGSTLVAGTSGIWTLSNPSGTLDVPAGTFGKAPSTPNRPPQQTSQGPNTGPAPLPVDPPKPLEPKGIDKQTDPACQTTPTASGCTNSIVVISTTPAPTPPPPQPLVSGSGYATSVAFYDSYAGVQSNGNATATFNSAGQLTSVNYSDGQVFTLNPATGSHADFGTDGILAWGRWIGPVTGMYNCDGLCSFNRNYNADQGLHYVIGMPTAVMPTGGTATYSLLGATSPTFADGRSAPGTASFLPGGGLTINFGTSVLTLTGFNVAMSAVNYTLNGSTTISSSLFSMTPTVTASSGGCSYGCSSLVNGFFAGTNAERAAMAYRINDYTAQVVGAAALTKTGP